MLSIPFLSAMPYTPGNGCTPSLRVYENALNVIKRLILTSQSQIYQIKTSKQDVPSACHFPRYIQSIKT